MQNPSTLSGRLHAGWIFSVQDASNLHSVPESALTGAEAVGLHLHVDGAEGQALPAKGIGAGSAGAHVGDRTGPGGRDTRPARFERLTVSRKF